MAEASLRLARKLERTIAEGHPWLWREALEPHELRPGTVVRVTDKRGRFLARGLADGGPIAVRIFTTSERERVDDALLSRRIAFAATLRDRVLPAGTSCYRLLHGEGDFLPGVVCDVYGRFAVLRLDGAGAAAWSARIEAALRGALAARGVTSLIARRGRGSEKEAEIAWGEPPDEIIQVEEHGMRLAVDVMRGQKTGLFLDHRDSRLRVRAVGRGARVLNLFGYTGAFSVAAGLGGATRVDTVDVAAPALALADQSWRDNGLDPSLHQSHRADAFEFLAAAAARGERWDVIIADPPSFAPNEAAVPRALASYRRLHQACYAALAPGGLYLAASCSSHVRGEAFEATLLAAAARPRRSLQRLDRWGAPADHPRLPAFPEGDYLDALLMRVS